MALLKIWGEAHYSHLTSNPHKPWFIAQYATCYSVGKEFGQRMAGWYIKDIIILKIRKSKSVGGSIDSRPGEDQQSTQRRSTTLLILGGRLTIDAERINSQLSLSREKTITSVGVRGGSTVNVERVNSQCREGQQSTCTFARKGYCLCWRGGGREMDAPSDIPCVARVGH